MRTTLVSLAAQRLMKHVLLDLDGTLADPREGIALTM